MGAILFPLVLVFLGLWFLVRNEQRIPMLSAERMLGVVFLYLNILSWMHWFSGGGWDLAKLGQGGGYIGGFFERLLVVALGDSGAAVVLVAWLLVSLAFTFDLSIPDLFRKLTSPAVKTGEFIAEKSSKIAQPLTEKMEGESSKPAIVFKEGNTHPQGFTPIGGKRVKKNGAGKDAAAQPDQAGAQETSLNGKQMARIFQSSASSIDWELPDYKEILNPAAKAVVRQNIDQERAKVIEETLKFIRRAGACGGDPPRTDLYPVWG